MFGLHILLHFALLRGLSVVVISKFDFVNFIKYIETYKISTAHIVPPIAVGLAKHPAVEQADLSSCRVFFSGAAPLSDSLASAIKTRTGIPIKQGYGMTEMTPAHCIGETNNIVDGSSGVLLPNCLARIVDLEGDDVETGKEGELWAKGPHIMIGYLNNDKATPETIDKDGWLHTGDIARIDADGNLFIVDRLKELIKYKGFQVPPAELEALLLTHPAIADAAVIGKRGR